MNCHYSIIMLKENLNSPSHELYVRKRDNSVEPVSFDKILRRIKSLSIINGVELNINFTTLTMKIIDQLYDNIHTYEIDELTAQQCASMSTQSIDYGILASRILISNHHKNTTEDFYKVINELYYFKDVNNEPYSLVSKELKDCVEANKELIQSKFDFTRDYELDYFGFKTLERAYLMRVNGKIIERPQHMWMRVALGIHGNDLETAFETYDLMSKKYFTHATPTLFNSGTPRPQMSSCYLLGMEDDSIKGIYNTLGDCAAISKWAGGIGLHIHNVRSKGSHIRGTNGTSNGLVPMLRVFNNTARYVDQCVLPDTIIYTTDGPIAICNLIQNENNVFNLTGNVETVKKILEHSYSGEIYNINTMHSLHNLKITPEHPVFSINNQKKGVNYSVIENRLDKGLITPEWTDVKNLNNESMIGYAIPSYNKDIIDITCDDCYFYGLLLGDGHVIKNKNYGHITMNTDTKSKQLDFIKEYFNKNCINFTETVSDERKITRIRWNKNVDFKFNYSDIYDINNTKTINKRFLNLPIEKSMYIIKGLIESDSCIYKEIVFDTTSENLLHSIMFLLLKLGVLTSGYIRDRVGESHISENKKISYSLRIPKTKKICDLLQLQNEGNYEKFFKYKNYIFTRIKSISKENYEGVVYDLQFENEHNYITHNGVIHNGGGRRNGSFAMYLEPWHADVFDFLELKKNHGDEEIKARDLFYALWIPDLFMKRVKQDSEWTLMCPDKCPGLSDVYGEEFEELYTKYEREGLGNKTVRARDLWIKMLDSQTETGTPYMLYKDAANKKSNQKNIGTIKSSNLCCEILQYSDDKETSVCNLASIGLPMFVEPPKIDNITNVQMYTKSDCVYCELAKSYLNEYGIEFSYEVLDDDTQRKAKYTELNEKFKPETQINSVPQIIINGKYIGGATELMNELKHTFNYDKLHKVTKVITNNLNRVIDVNFYPTEKTRISNLKNRPIGIGVQGLADVYAIMNISFSSKEAQEINENIFETIYHASCEKSMELAKERKQDLLKLRLAYRNRKYQFTTTQADCNEYIFTDETTQEEKELLYKHIPTYSEVTELPDYYCGSYSTFTGSPASQGKLQYDMWNETPSSRYDWASLKEEIINNGMRNSLLVAPMPTASTSQILGNNECFEPFTSNIYLRRTIAGEFIVINKHLMKTLTNMGLWNEDIKNSIILHKGSIQQLKHIPKIIRDVYKIVWEIPMRDLIDMAHTRGKYVCQSQSMNLWMENPTYDKLTAMHFYTWSKGLKTGIYYLRTKAKASAQQFTIDPTKITQYKNNDYEPQDEDEGCLMCSG